MRNNNYFKNKKITIIGLARSGGACANLLYRLGAKVCVTEILDNKQTRQACANLESSEIVVELGKHSQEFIQSADLVVISPGVSVNSLPIIWAKKFNRPVISEIEVASILCAAKIIAITGSNGKTTVTTLIGNLLAKAGKKVFVCGNIGNPFCAEVEKMQEGDFVALEISSYQLETIKDFKPFVAIILNLTPNHLDHYNNLQEYLLAKERITLNQDKNNFLLLNANDALLKSAGSRSKAKVVYFTKQAGLNPNQSAVLSVGKILGISEEIILASFKEFKGLEHRLENVALVGGVKFINDSKATTADSAIWAIKNIDSPIILIAGGRHKGIDYRVILESCRSKVKQAILIGEAKERIAVAIGEEFPCEFAVDLEQAVNQAFALAKPKDTILFSPMCSSFDMFIDYEDRGRVFKKIVLELAQRVNSHG